MFSSNNPDRDAYIAGLRKLADWLEKRPDANVPLVADILLPLMANPAVEAYATATGLDVRYDSDGNASAVTKFGPIEYRAYGYADWDRHITEHSEQVARAWADKNGMVIEPREGGAR